MPRAREERADHDVVIVGGGPAGLSTALFLAHLRPAIRAKMVVLEKERYPREKYCAGAIGARAERALGRTGVVVDVPSVDIDGISIALPEGTIEAHEGRIGRVVRRIEYDAALADAARSRGIAIAEGTKVLSIEPGPDFVRVCTSRGELRARAVVGADGVGSMVRRSLGFGPGMWRAQVLEVDTEPVASDRPRGTLHFDAADPGFTGYSWDFATVSGGLPLVCRGVYRLVLPGANASGEDLAARLARRLARVGLDLGRCKKKRYAERGFAPHEPLSRPRVLLVGEAAGVDPITGEGIAQGLLYGEAAAPYLLERLDRNQLTFGDWGDELAKTMLGVDFRVRHFLCRRYFGPARAFYERAFFRAPGALAMGVRYFKGEPLDLGLTARVARSVAGSYWQHRDLRPFDEPAPA